MVAAVVGVVAAAGAAYSANKSSKAMNKATDQAGALADRQMALAEAQYRRYLDTYADIEDSFANSARDYGSNANKELAAGQAAADVEGSFSTLRQKLNSTPGLDPSSARYQNMVKQIGVTEAAQKAAAETGARRNVEQTGLQMQQSAINVGKGVASIGLNAASGAGQAIGQVAGMISAKGAMEQQAWAGLGRMAGSMSGGGGMGTANTSSWNMSPGVSSMQPAGGLEMPASQSFDLSSFDFSVPSTVH